MERLVMLEREVYKMRIGVLPTLSGEVSRLKYVCFRCYNREVVVYDSVLVRDRHEALVNLQ